MKGALILVCVALLACALAWPASESNVLRFAVENQFLRQFPNLKTYAFKNCLPAAKEQVVINKLNFQPDPLVFPGPLDVSFNVTFKAETSSPVSAQVYLGKKVGSVWVKVPCIGNIGSCTYDDICTFLDGITCPSEFVAAGVPCQCPFKPGTYVLPKADFTVEVPVFPPGDYHAQANLTSGTTTLGCYDIMATFG